MSKIGRSSQVDIHIIVDREFYQAFLIALRKLRYKTLVEFYREKMREAIEESEQRAQWPPKPAILPVKRRERATWLQDRSDDSGATSTQRTCEE
jgi:hypothetical protein